MKNKKAQLQSGETIVVIVIVTILIVVGVVFATKSKTASITEEAGAINDLKAMDTAIIAANLNEIKCSEYNALVNTCIDYQRAQAFSNIYIADKQNSKDYYYSLFGNSKIELQIFIPDTPGVNGLNIKYLTIYDYDNSANKSSTPIFIPTIVLDSLKKQSYFAIIEVRTYS